MIRKSSEEYGQGRKVNVPATSCKGSSALRRTPRRLKVKLPGQHILHNSRELLKLMEGQCKKWQKRTLVLVTSL